MNHFDLSGKIAIITGADGLLGRQFSVALSQAGATTILCDLPDKSCIEMSRQIKDNGGKSVAIACDVTIEHDWCNLVKFCSEFPSIDILINSAAYTNQSKTKSFALDFFDSPASDFEEIIKVNLVGTYLGCKTIGKVMVNQKQGSIINMASLYGVVSPTHRIYEGTNIYQPAGYSTSKSAILGLTRYLSALWAEHNVRVNAITPGGIFNGHTDPFLSRFTEIVPMKRMGNPEELLGALLFLSSDASSYCTGQNIIIDGGWTVI